MELQFTQPIFLKAINNLNHSYLTWICFNQMPLFFFMCFYWEICKNKVTQS